MRFNSIKTKLIVMYAAVIMVVMIAGGTFMLLNVRRIEENRTRGALSHRADSIYDQVIRMYSREAFRDASIWLLFAHSEYNIEGLILNNEGVPIAPLAFVRPNLHFNCEAVIAAIAGNEGFTRNSLGPDVTGAERQWFTYARPVEIDGQIFVIYARIGNHYVNTNLSTLTFYMLINLLITLVLTVIFWIFLGDTLTKPIVELTRQAKAIASGDWSKGAVIVGGQDEIGQLALDFNYMSQELRATLSRMASEKNKSQAILQNTSHGVLAYDVAGALIHINNAGEELLQSDINLRSMHVHDALKMLGFHPEDVYNLQPGDVCESTIEDGDYHLFACATSYTGEGGEIDGYVIVLQDITRQRKLDNMRKEFVANVSHELRTPLTSIRTYAETLLEGVNNDPETTNHFLKVITEEAQRMTHLVSDLLELSRIDAQYAAPETDVVDLAGLLSLTIRQSQVHAEQKQQQIIFDAPLGACLIDANATRINQVISNILSNSIKYSPENTVIRVDMESTATYYRVFIQDQGIGIPSDSIERIFERFYRVDKARSRAMGGTGLGLAIVKEIMEEHGGRVHVSSQPGQGTTMTLRFNRLAEA